jgi:hypothetical protein
MSRIFLNSAINWPVYKKRWSNSLRTLSATVILPEPFHAKLVWLNSRSIHDILKFDRMDAGGCWRQKPISRSKNS